MIYFILIFVQLHSTKLLYYFMFPLSFWQYRDGNMDGILVPVDTVAPTRVLRLLDWLSGKKHVGVVRQRYTVQQCAVTVIDKQAAKLMHCLLIQIQTMTHRCMSATA